MTYTYRLRIRNAANSADALTVTSVVGGTNPYISQPPSGDGLGFNPRTGQTEIGAYTISVADNGSTANVITGFLSDGAGRYDKLGRLAYLEYGTDGVTFPNLLVPGYVTKIRYLSAAEAEVTIGEAQRAEQTKLAFQTATSTFPATTMLGGGPIRWPAGVNVTPINWPNRGPWTMKLFVKDSPTGTSTLRFVSGYIVASESADDFTYAANGVFPDYMISRINTLTATEVPGSAITPPYVQNGNVYADVYSGGSLINTFPVVSPPGGTRIGFGGQITLAWTNADPVGTLYQVFLYTKTISENSPLHVLMHPVDIVTGLTTEAGETYDATTAAAVKASIGADVRVFLRLTSSEPTDAAIARLMGLFGFGRRINSSNAWEFFDARTKSTAAPATTIALADLREVPSDLWSLDDSTIINNVTVNAQRFAIWAPGQGQNRPADSLIPVEQKRTARFQLSDGTYPDASQGVKELAYDLPGTILNANGSEVDLTSFTAALAAPTFDRWGYGAPATALACLPTVTAKVGDEVVLDLSALPNGSARGGQRIVQLVQRTNAPGGPTIQVEDAGLSAQPATAPTFTIAASTRSTQTAADITLTNAAALVTAGVTAVVVEWAVSASSPAAAGQDLGSILPAAPVVLTTPVVAAGSKVWARAKSVQAGRRAGNFTAWASVTLTGVSAPTSLSFTATPADGSSGLLGWTAGAGSSTYAVRVQLRPSALTSASNVPFPTLLPGSTGYPITGLTPGASYTATVEYLDPTSGIVAASASITFTAGASIVVLAPPTAAHGIVGETDANGVIVVNGRYGLDVTASVLPGAIEFWEATEVSPGTGFYTAPALVRTLAAVNAGPTRYRNTAPHDGLRRQLTARHVSGTSASVFTYPVTLDPWGAAQGSLVEAELTNLKRADTDTATTWTFTPSASVDSLWAAYRVVTSPETNADWDALAAAVTPLPAGTTSYTVPRPADGQVTIARIEPRRADLSVGLARVLTVTATPQGPLEDDDDETTTTTGIQWFRLVERGLAVTAVRFATQIGAAAMSAFGPATRVEGDPSTVKGGTLGYLEFEHEDLLDADRQMWVIVEYDLANGQTIRKTFPGFDRNKNPQITADPVIAWPKVTITADNDTKSVRLRSSTRPWSRTVDGTFATFDVSTADASGNAGLSLSASDTFFAEALSDPIAYVSGSTLIDSRAVVISGTSAPLSSALWDTVSVAAPATNGDDQVAITLKATGAPVGWTVKLYIAELNGVPTVDETANVSPALSSPPTASTVYDWMSAYPRSGAAGHARLNTLRLRADLLDNFGVVQDTRSVSASWYTGGF